jgi:hypothetical protein
MGFSRAFSSVASNAQRTGAGTEGVWISWLERNTMSLRQPTIGAWPTTASEQFEMGFAGT